MATHDYVIANGTGAAVRSDLNNALAAIVSNNSSSSEPGTTYAYQWWADTNANVLKLRNSSNDGWVTLRELDGTMLIEDGSAASPGLAFADDTDTGIFSPGSDNIAFATGGAERFRIDSNEAVFNEGSNSYDFRVESNGLTHALFVDGSADAVGIGTSAPSHRLDVRTASGNAQINLRSGGDLAQLLLISNDTSGQSQVNFGDNDANNKGIIQYAHSDDSLRFTVNSSERARIDSSGNLGVGTTSPSQLVTVSSGGDTQLLLTSTNSTAHDRINFTNSGSSASGGLWYAAGNTMEFRTDDTERMRLFSSGGLGIGTSNQIASSQLTVGGSNGMFVRSTGVDGTFADLLSSFYSGNNNEKNTIGASVSGNGLNSGFQFRASDGSGASSQTTVCEMRKSEFRVFTDGANVLKVLSSGRLKVSNSAGSGSTYHTNVNFSSIHTDTGGNVIAGFENSHTSDPYGIVIKFSGDDADNNSNYFIEANDTSATRFQVLSDGDVRNHDNSYGSISDEKLKQDIVDAGSQWDDLKDLRVRKFKFKSDVAAYGDEAKVLIGLVAQEAELVSPGLVSASPDRDDEGNDLGTTTKAVRYSVLYMKAIKALQEAMDRIETLEAKVAALEAG
jgi:hypothetical protein